MSDRPTLVTCIRCGWVSSAVTSGEAEAHVNAHNAWRATLPPEHRRFYRHAASMEGYGCMGCGKWGPYRPARPEDAPNGCTINPVIWDGPE